MNLRKPIAALAAATLAVVAGLTVSGCERDKYAKSTQAPTTTTTTTAQTGSESATMGQAFDDTTITTKVKTVLLADPDVKGLEVNVDTKNGIVTLTGLVDTQAQADKAASVAAQTQGVKSVNNNLTKRG